MYVKTVIRMRCTQLDAEQSKAHVCSIISCFLTKVVMGHKSFMDFCQIISPLLKRTLRDKIKQVHVSVKFGANVFGVTLVRTNFHPVCSAFVQ